MVCTVHSHFHVQSNYSIDVVLCRWGCDKIRNIQHEVLLVVILFPTLESRIKRQQPSDIMRFLGRQNSKKRIKVLLLQPQRQYNLNTAVGLDTKMILQTPHPPPPPTTTENQHQPQEPRMNIY